MKEIARQLFLSLNRDEPTTHMYYVLCDQNYKARFWAENDKQAKVKFREYLLAKRIMSQDEVASRKTTVEDVMKAIEESPLDVIQYLLELLEQ